jgi:hypothetical protein
LQIQSFKTFADVLSGHTYRFTWRTISVGAISDSTLHRMFTVNREDPGLERYSEMTGWLVAFE